MKNWRENDYNKKKRIKYDEYYFVVYIFLIVDEIDINDNYVIFLGVGVEGLMVIWFF